MNYVKICRESSLTELENEINEFLGTTDDDLIDIKYSGASYGEGASFDIYWSALLIMKAFEDEEDKSKSL